MAVLRSGCKCQLDIPPRREAVSTEFSEITERRSSIAPDWFSVTWDQRGVIEKCLLALTEARVTPGWRSPPEAQAPA